MRKPESFPATASRVTMTAQPSPLQWQATAAATKLLGVPRRSRRKNALQMHDLVNAHVPRAHVGQDGKAATSASRMLYAYRPQHGDLRQPTKPRRPVGIKQLSSQMLQHLYSARTVSAARVKQGAEPTDVQPLATSRARLRQPTATLGTVFATAHDPIRGRVEQESKLWPRGQARSARATYARQAHAA